MMDAPTKIIHDAHDYITGMSKTSNIEVQSISPLIEARVICNPPWSNIDDKPETEPKESMQSLMRTSHY